MRDDPGGRRKWPTWKEGQGYLLFVVTLLGDGPPDLAPSSQPGEGRGTGRGRAAPGRSSTRGRTCLDRVHKANLDGGKGFEQAEGPWHAVTRAGQAGAPSGGGGGEQWP